MPLLTGEHKIKALFEIEFDMILRYILEQLPRINALVSFNIGDFQDVCRRKNIRIINYFSYLL